MTVRRKRHVNATRARLCRASDARRPRRRHPVREPGCGTRGPPPGLRGTCPPRSLSYARSSSGCSPFLSIDLGHASSFLFTVREPSTESIAASKSGPHGRPSLTTARVSRLRNRRRMADIARRRVAAGSPPRPADGVDEARARGPIGHCRGDDRSGITPRIRSEIRWHRRLSRSSRFLVCPSQLMSARP